MTTGPSREHYDNREVPFDEWVDIDTLVNRASVSSGDFDYILRPICSECGEFLSVEYDEGEAANGDEGAEGPVALARLVCDDCRILWRVADEDAPGES